MKLKEKIIINFLINTGIISKKHLQRLISETKKTDKMLCEVAHEMGLISKEEIELIEQVSEEIPDPKKAFQFAVGLRRKLGELLTLSGKITKKQLNEALRIQRETGEKIGEILVKRGYLNERELKAFLAFQAIQEDREFPKRFRIGEILVSLGLVTEEAVSKALEIQKLHPHKELGEILVESGFLTPKDVKKGLKLQEKIISLVLSAILIFSNIFSFDYVMAQPESAKATVHIVVEVKGYAKLNPVKQIKEFKVTHEDLLKGYVDLVNATEMEIKTNMKQFFISFEGIAEEGIQEVEIYGFPEPIKITPAGGLILIKNPPKVAHYELSYRFKLNEKATEKTYEWPYKVSVFY